MSLPFDIDNLRSTVDEMTRSVFDTLFQCSVELRPDDSSFEAALTGAVYYAGAWDGALLLECSSEQAIEWAGRILGTAAPEFVDDDAKDAIGELTNMLAGNLKPMLPGGVGLSTPSVVAGPASGLRIWRGNPVDRMLFMSPSGPFRITLMRVVRAS